MPRHSRPQRPNTPTQKRARPTEQPSTAPTGSHGWRPPHRKDTPAATLSGICLVSDAPSNWITRTGEPGRKKSRWQWPSGNFCPTARSGPLTLSWSLNPLIPSPCPLDQKQQGFRDIWQEYLDYLLSSCRMALHPGVATLLTVDILMI